MKAIVFEYLGRIWHNLVGAIPILKLNTNEMKERMMSPTQKVAQEAKRYVIVEVHPNRNRKDRIKVTKLY